MSTTSRSRSGRGPRVSPRRAVSVPRACPYPVAATLSPAAAAPAATRALRVVVVEDDAATRELLSELLLDEGYEVVLHNSADGVHDLVRRITPEVILLDLWMAGREGGWEVLDRLALDPRTREIPVVLISDALPPGPHHPARTPVGGLRLIAKPFDLATLLAALDDVLRPRADLPV